MGSSNSYVGSPVERIEDLRLLRGRGKFVDDLSLPGQLWAVILRSPIAHGRILSIDARKGLATSGVHAVITASDIGSPVPRIPARLFPVPEFEDFQQPVIAEGKVRYVGEPVAVVIADSAAICEDALDLIAVDIETLDPVTTPEQSEANVTLLFEDRPTNSPLTYQVRRGPPAVAVFAEAAFTRRERFYVHRHTGIMMETRGVLAHFDSATGRITVLGASKVPFANRRILAQTMGISLEQIDMIEGDTGGSFGVRGEFFPEDFLIPFCAKYLGRPVKWIEDRREHFTAISHARDIGCDIEIAVDEEGRITALRGKVATDIGAYVRTAGAITPRNVGQFLCGPYRIPSIEIDVAVQMSNKAPSGTYRGPGRYEADFFRERLIDLAAVELGIDRVEFRRRNLVATTELPYALPTVAPAPNPTELDSGDYVGLMDRCLAEFGWAQKVGSRGWIDDRYHGYAVGCFIEGGAAGPSENARIDVAPGGGFNVYVGSSAVGQGIATTLSQIAADALEVPIGRIELFHGSTIYLKDGWGSYHSRSTVMGGSAILMAAHSVKLRLCELAAKRLGISPDEVRYAEGMIEGGGQSIQLIDLVGEKISVEETFRNSKHTYSYGTHAAHVAVDIRTGRIEVLDYVVVEDCGRIINPQTLKGQVIGAVVQGLGGTILEHLKYDEGGQLITASFADYLMPLATDFPNIRSFSVQLHRSPNNPLGAKGAGEGGIIPVGGIIANAVADALREFGVCPTTLPLSPPEVWKLAHRAGAV